VYFYELHEGDDDLVADAILARETAMPREEFFALVQEIRGHIQDRFEEDSLAEAIAGELEREHDFVFVSDDRIVASVRVSSVPGENALIAADGPEAARHIDDDTEADDDADAGDDAYLEDDADLDELPDYLTIVADLELPPRLS
jgi:hypothetical protein